MQTIEQVQASWAALDRQAKMEAWDQFTRDLDYGQAGWNEYFLILMPLWERGEEPDFGLAPAVFDDEFDDIGFDMDAYPMPAEIGAFDQHIPW